MSWTEKPLSKPIQIEDVVSVYSGRPGCCCGCRGKHTYRSSTREEGTKLRGYKVWDKEVSDRTVARIVNKVNKDPATVGEYWNKKLSHYQLDLVNRWYIVYPRKS